MTTHRLETIGFYTLLVTIILAPLIFIRSSVISLDVIKVAVIALGTLISALSLGFAAYKEKTLTLPPKVFTWTSVLVLVSLVLSALFSPHVAKSFFGQGFEAGTASFVIILFLAGLVSFNLTVRRVQRGGVLFAGMAVSFIILALFHAGHFIFGLDFLHLSILKSIGSTIFGTWSSLGAFSLFVALITLCAIVFLPLSRRMKGAYWSITVVAGIAGLLSFVPWTLITMAITLLILSIHLFLHNKKSSITAQNPFGNIPWIPCIAFLFITAVLLFGGPSIGKVQQKTGALYIEYVLPWQMTLDVATGALKESPIFGTGPNHFGQAFLAYKPLSINTTELWGIEFGNAIGTIPTFFITQGLLGSILWTILLILIGVFGTRSLRKPTDATTESPYSRFILASSFMGTVFSWILMIGYAPSHVFLMIAFVTTGIWLGSAIHYGRLHPYVIHTHASVRASRIFSICTGILIMLGLLLMLMYIKSLVAKAYFVQGVNHLSAEGNADSADASFARAVAIDPSDIYWQARAEAGLIKIRTLANSSGSAASSTQLANEIAKTLESSINHTTQAIAYNRTNYYNYLSAARVLEMAMSFKIPNAYENTVTAYTSAANLNPYNPSLYLNVARVEASQGKYDKALQAIGAALQVKQNYAEAAFMASQVAAAQGNIADAITAAKVTSQLSPNNPIVFFQLGILHYTNKDYTPAAEALKRAVDLQPDYANAQYFLGLSYVRLGRMSDATEQFELIVKSNPDNQEVALILSNLREGRSPFEDAEPPITPTPEKRPALPFKQRN